MMDQGIPVDRFPQRVLRRPPGHRRADAVACALLVGLDVLCRVEAVTVALAIACRLWITAAAQLVVLTSAAVFVASLATYWNP
ncbi:hypothetical protein [Streptomyces sp. NPDC002276]